MASTITVQDLINYARTHVKLAPLDGLGGFTSEPALRWANKIKKHIIQSPYDWEWNRSSIPSFLTVDEQSEYNVLVPDIGWLVDAWMELEASAVNNRDIRYLDIKRNIRKPWQHLDPSQICYMLDRNRNPVLRLDTIPRGSIWRIFVDYQRKPSRITALTGATGTFDPIPDEMEDVLTQFFIALAYKLVDRQDHLRELALAEQLLQEHRAYLSQEETEVGFVPERGLFLG